MSRLEISAAATRRWYDGQNQLHRDDGPAVEYIDGLKLWYQHGKQHRVGGPAAEYPDDVQYWLQYDKLHRVDGPAVIEKEDQKWCVWDIQYELVQLDIYSDEYNVCFGVYGDVVAS